MVPGYASECSSHNHKNLYSKNYGIVLEELSKLVSERLRNTGTILGTTLLAPLVGFQNWPMCTGITIRNSSNFYLQYCFSENIEGYFFTGDGNASESFQGPGIFFIKEID